MGEVFTGRPEPAHLRAGIIGAGFIGAVHANAVRRSGSRVVGVVASSPERSKEAVQRVGAERAFADAEEMVASDQIDVVHVCTPNCLVEPEVPSLIVVPSTEVVQDNIGDLRDLCFE